MSQVFLGQNIKALFFGFWQTKTPKEKVIWKVVATLVAMTLFYLWLEAPLSHIKKLQIAIPQEKQKLAMMAELVGQYTQLKENTKNSNVVSITRELVEASLLKKNIRTQNLSVMNENVRVQTQASSYDHIQEWLLDMQKTYRMQVEEVKLINNQEAGVVTATLNLRQIKTDVN